MKAVKNIAVIGLLFSVIACGNNEEKVPGTVKITGELKNQPEGVVVLSEYRDDRTEIVDTIPVSDKGGFDYQLSLEAPGFYELNLYDEKMVRLALFAEDVDVKYDFQEEDGILITGSKDTEQVMKVDELASMYQEEINDLNTQYYEAMSANDQDAVKAIQERSMEMVSHHAERVKATLRDMDGSFASLAAVGMIDP